MNMSLWSEWYRCVRMLRAACARRRTFVYMALALVGLSVRSELAGVTSFIRAVALRPALYRRLLHLFHSEGLEVQRLTRLWVRLVLKLFAPLRVGPYLVCVADGLKVPKEGKKMPGVKKLHQSSGNNSKPPFIMGHSFQAVSLLVRGAADVVAAIPLASRIHEGLVWNSGDRHTLLDKMVTLFLFVVQQMGCPVLLVADAYYASRKIILPLIKQGHQLVTRVRINAVAYYPADRPAVRRRGRPRLYGKKVRLRDLALHSAAFITAASPLYRETNVHISYRSIDLLWRPIGRLVRFVIVHHPTRGTIFLMSTDTSLDPLEIITIYGYRFKIELGFRHAIHVLGTYAYHFWMKTMTPIRNNTADQHLENRPEQYRKAVRRKLKAYHCHVQLGCIAQGLLQHLALNFSETVWNHFRSWLRTTNRQKPPSELVVAYALRSHLFQFLAVAPTDHTLKKIILENLDPTLLPEYTMVA